MRGSDKQRKASLRSCLSVQCAATAIMLVSIATIAAVCVAVTFVFGREAAEDLAVQQVESVASASQAAMSEFVSGPVRVVHAFQQAANMSTLPAIAGVPANTTARAAAFQTWLNVSFAHADASMGMHAFQALGFTDGSYVDCGWRNAVDTIRCVYIDRPLSNAEYQYDYNLTRRTAAFTLNTTISYDPRGRHWYNTGSSSARGTRQWLAEPESSVDGTLILIVSGPLHDATGAFVGVAAAAYRFQTLQTIFSRIESKGCLFVLTGALTVLAATCGPPPVAQQCTGRCFYTANQSGFAPLRALALDHPSVLKQSAATHPLTLDGDMYYVASDSIASDTVGPPWVVVYMLKHKVIFSRVETGRNYAIIIAVCLVVVAAVITALVMALLLHPLRNIAAHMIQVATMADDVLRARPPTGMLEIQQIGQALAFLCAELIRLRGFLPQGVLAAEEGADLEELADDVDDTGSATSIAEHRNPLANSRDSGGDLDAMLGMPPLRPSGPPSMINSSSSSALLNTGLRVATRRVSALAVNVRNFHGMIKSWTSDDFTRIYAELVAAVLAVSREHRGVLELFSGDHFLLSFNSFKHVANYSEAGARCALGLHQHHHIPPDVTCGLSSGYALVGNMGCRDTKRGGSVGTVVTCAALLERLCKRYPRVTILTHGLAAVDAACRVEALHIDAVTLPGYDNRQLLTSLVREKPTAVAEWMYELEAADSDSRYTTLNRAFLAYLKGDFADAFAQLAAVRSTGSDVDPTKELLSRLLQHRIDGTRYRNPLPHYYADCLVGSSADAYLNSVSAGALQTAHGGRVEQSGSCSAMDSAVEEVCS